MNYREELARIKTQRSAEPTIKAEAARLLIGALKHARQGETEYLHYFPLDWSFLEADAVIEHARNEGADVRELVCTPGGSLFVFVDL